MKSRFYAVKCITNMHMGSGDTNFNIIDNEVQKDPITNYPIMHASGIKGAMRDYFRAIESKSIELIFGSERVNSSEENKVKTQPGTLKFLSAQTFFIPVRSADSNESYYIATSVELLKSFGDLYYAVTGKDVTKYYLKEVSNLNESEAYYRRPITIKIENNSIDVRSGNKISASILKIADKFYPSDYEKNKLLIMPHKYLSSVRLPILARNQLDSGISKNLWYEEVVPHGTVFVFGVMSDGTHSGDNALEIFHNAVNGKLIQFGGNATIGCGLTTVIALN